MGPPQKDRSDDISHHERTPLPRSYISLPVNPENTVISSTSGYLTNNTLIWDGERDVAQSRAFAHGAMGRRIDPSWGGPIELFLVPASAPRLV